MLKDKAKSAVSVEVSLSVVIQNTEPGEVVYISAFTSMRFLNTV